MVIAMQHDLGSDDRTLMGCGGPEGTRSGLDRVMDAGKASQSR